MKAPSAGKHCGNAVPACVYVLYENKCLVGIYKGVIHVLAEDFFHNWPPYTQLEIFVLTMKKKSKLYFQRSKSLLMEKLMSKKKGEKNPNQTYYLNMLYSALR